MKAFRISRVAWLPAVLLLALTPALGADSLGQALDVAVEAHKEAVRSQARIDKLDDDMRRMRADMQDAVTRKAVLDAQLPDLQRRAGEQVRRRAALERELSAVQAGQIDVEPVLQRMVSGLEQQLASDLPFLLDQRRERVAGLRRLLAKPDVGAADKLRAVLEVSQVELQYGRSIEVYDGQLTWQGRAEPVQFLRVGRLMLFYLNEDGTRPGYWDRAARNWKTLPAAEAGRLREAIRMAQGEIPPELLELPLPAPEAGS